MKLLRRHLFTILGLCISVFALFFLGKQFDISELVEAMNHVDLVMLLPVPALILLSFAMRAQRWRLLVEHQPPIRFLPSFSALMIGYLFNNLFPARAGDVARALELGRSEKMSRTKVFATLVTERTVDLFTTLSLLVIVLMSYPALPKTLKESSAVFAFLAFGALSLLVLIHITGQRWITPLLGILARWLPHQVNTRLEQIIHSLLEGIAGMFRPSHAFGFLLLTGLVWTIEVLMVYVVALAVGLPLALGNAFLVLLILAMGSMVPSSPSQVGTYEFVGLAALALIDLKGPLALAFIALLHLLTLAGSTTIGVICLLLRKRSPALMDEGPLA